MTRDLPAGSLAEIRRQQVRRHYGHIASQGSCCSVAPGASGCGGRSSPACSGPARRPVARRGYTTEELSELPAGADLGLGCGHPTDRIALKPGQVVLDLGSGAGVDCFLASRKVGRNGHVIGVDMTPEMIERARANARQARYPNVEFRLGEIEHLPVADGSVDVIISNCVVNLAPEQAPVYQEAFRVLRPGGQLAVSDVVATRPISATDRADPSRWSSCVSGALPANELRTLLREAGFRRIRIDLAVPGAAGCCGPPSRGVVAAEIRTTKPRG